LPIRQRSPLIASRGNREELVRVVGNPPAGLAYRSDRTHRPRANRIDIHFRPTPLGALPDGAATPLSSATDQAQILSVPIELRHYGRESKLLIGATDPFATVKPDARLIKLLIRARRFNATLVGSDGVPFSELAQREGVSPSYLTRLVRLSHLALDIIQAILDGRQPRDLTADKLLAHSRLPLTGHEQRRVLGFT
jgi:hypothetical protein